MARYDVGWRERVTDAGYDPGWWNPEGVPRGRDPARGARQERYDRQWRDPGFSPGVEEEWRGTSMIYGPARYGLGPYHERLRNRKREDDELREEVEEALFYDTWVDADAIRVEVQDGIVTLRGSLPSYEEIRYATDDAWDVDGVRGVHSELEVRDR